MRKLKIMILAISFTVVMGIAAFAASYYEYNDQTDVNGMELISALYLDLADNNDYTTITVGGITRVETGMFPIYDPIYLESEVSYSHYPNNDGVAVFSFPSTTREYVDDIWPESAYYTSRQDTTYTGYVVRFGWGYHTASVLDENLTEIMSAEASHYEASLYSADEPVEMMS